MSDTKEITWPETIAYKITNALRFSGIIDEDNYIVEQEARNEITPIIRRWCIPIERIEDWKARAEALEVRVQELEAQLAAQAWRPMETVPDGEDVELLVHGYIGDDGLWYYRDGTTPLKGWRPID